MNNIIQMKPIVERTESGALVISSETFAEGTANQHKNVLQLIRTYRDDLEEFGPLESETRMGNRGGVPAEVFLMTEPQATLVLTYMRNMKRIREFKIALVKSFYEMAWQLQATPAPADLSRMEILQLAMQAEQEKVALSAELEIARPKAEYVDKFVAENDYHLFRTVASDLMVGEMELRWALVYTGWIYHDQQRRRNSKNDYVTEHLWSEYATKKLYFFRALNHQAPLFKGNVAHTLKVTTPGVSAVGRLVEKILTEHPGTLSAALPLLEQRYNERKSAAS